MKEIYKKVNQINELNNIIINRTNSWAPSAPDTYEKAFADETNKALTDAVKTLFEELAELIRSSVTSSEK